MDDMFIFSGTAGTPPAAQENVATVAGEAVVYQGPKGVHFSCRLSVFLVFMLPQLGFSQILRKLRGFSGVRKAVY